MRGNNYRWIEIERFGTVLRVCSHVVRDRRKWNLNKRRWAFRFYRIHVAVNKINGNLLIYQIFTSKRLHVDYPNNRVRSSREPRISVRFIRVVLSETRTPAEQTAAPCTELCAIIHDGNGKKTINIIYVRRDKIGRRARVKTAIILRIRKRTLRNRLACEQVARTQYNINFTICFRATQSRRADKASLCPRPFALRRPGELNFARARACVYINYMKNRMEFIFHKALFFFIHIIYIYIY